MRARPLLTIDHAVLVAAAKLASLPETADAAAFNAAVAGVERAFRRSTAVQWNDVTDKPALIKAVRGDAAFLRQSVEELRQGKPVSDRNRWQALLDNAGTSLVLKRKGVVSAVPAMTGVASIVAHALVLLSDESRGLLSRFGRCRYVRCQQPWFFAERTGQRGRFKTEFCRPEHASAQVQIDYRERQKAAKHK